ncbi:unnamed protein product [Rotaria sp. Silwood2]|nr:unnamed protein product [Rotaria sp. Silwood2]
MPVNIIVTVRKTMKRVAALNIFDDAVSRSNPFNLRTAIISTRFYFALLILSLITLVIFTSLSNENISITIRNPSEASYEYLLRTYSRTLSCQCSRTIIPYSDFTSTNIKYHPVCSSMFVSDDWIDCLLSPNMNTLYQADFRAFASTFFQSLVTFCSHAQRSINDALDNLPSETLLTPDILSFQSLDVKVQAKSQFLQTSTANSLVRLLELVRSTTYTDTLYSAFQTSELLLKTTTDNGSITLIEVKVSLFPNDSTECECLITPTCSLPAGFFNGTDIGIIATIWSEPLNPVFVNGISFSCYPIESLLQSTLECFFNQSCLETLLQFFSNCNTLNIDVLNINQTHFTADTTIEELISLLFIENWSVQTLFTNYFTLCAPMLCTYTTEKRKSLLYVITQVLGIYGGLTVTLRVCIPIIVGWWRKRRINTRTEANPSMYDIE